MSSSDENTRLLRNKSSPNVAGLRYESTNPNMLRTPGRPPLYSMPSNQSLKSLKSLSSISDPIIDNYIQSRTRTSKNDDINSSIVNFNLLYDDEGTFDSFAYFAYYFPIFKWLPNYKIKESLVGDFLAGISLCSFQVPLVMSFATSLAHLPPITSLYSIIIGACTYSIFGCVPVLVVGPSPSSALIYGQVIELFNHEKSFGKFTKLEISSTLSSAMGGILLGSGLLRFGFLDNVLSRALLKGFIAAMGLIMIINELSTEMGIAELSLKEPHLTTLDKLLFVIKYFKETHILPFLISTITLSIVLIVRKVKSLLIHKYNKKWAIYIPELFMMIVAATYFCWHFKWYENGVGIIGDITHSTGSVSIINPLKWSKLSLYKKTFSTSLLCTILGYFDSTTATKALGAKYNYNVSSNRELVALGVTNFFVSLIGALPSFGAFGRSKINLLSGATTPMAGIIMSLATVLAIVYLLPLLYYLPDCVLALSTTIVGITVLEEVPSDLKFFWDIGGYDEILTFMLIFGATILWSAQAGVTLGVILAVIRVIKHSTRSRIQVLGRIPNTSVFRNADELIEESFATFSNADNRHENENIHADKLSNLIAEIEEIEGVLIIKIPEPLNFANVSDLKSKLTRIEKYGTLLVHPSQPNKRDFNNKTIKFIIFDCKGMTYIDSSATQVLHEIVKKYIEIDDISVCFARVPVDSNVREKFKKSDIIKLVNTSYQNYGSGLLNRISNLDLNHIGISSSGMGVGFFLSIDEALKSIDIQNV